MAITIIAISAVIVALVSPKKKEAEKKTDYDYRLNPEALDEFIR